DPVVQLRGDRAGGVGSAPLPPPGTPAGAGRADRRASVTGIDDPVRGPFPAISRSRRAPIPARQAARGREFYIIKYRPPQKGGRWLPGHTHRRERREAATGGRGTRRLA